MIMVHDDDAIDDTVDDNAAAADDAVDDTVDGNDGDDKGDDNDNNGNDTLGMSAAYLDNLVIDLNSSINISSTSFSNAFYEDSRHLFYII